MGQDSESAAEFVMTVRTDHVRMKMWYNDESRSNESTMKYLKQQYGEYPSMWKEVLNWPGWKETRKEYLKYIQTSGNDMKEKNVENKKDGEDQARKRKSRWGSAPSVKEETSSEARNGNGGEELDGGNKGMGEVSNHKRRSRWGHEQTNDSTTSGQVLNPAQQPSILPPALSTMLPGMILPGAAMPQQLTPQQQEEMKELQARLRVINEKLDNLDSEAERVDALPRSDPERSPSPPPIYGADGKRKNTRAVRWRERYTNERQDILEKLLQLNPNTRKTSNLLFRKRSKKIRIPVEKHPTYNFIGLIIGPRGKTQKELEAKTGCKIAIRGRGSVKEGARGRRDGQVMQGDTDPLHVVITGDDQESVDAASSMIEQMLIVIDDEKNVHKQQQLRELALLNGTLKDEDIFCSICAEKGHRSFECPKQFNNNSKNKNGIPQVKCAICGDTSHPTRDCRQQPKNLHGIPGVSQVHMTDQKEMDSEYLSFMAEIDGRKVEKLHNPPLVESLVGESAGVGYSQQQTNSLPLPPPLDGGIQPPSGNAPQLTLLTPLALPGAPRQLPPPPPQLPPPPPIAGGGLGNSVPQPKPLPPHGLPLPPPPTGSMQLQQSNNNYYRNHMNDSIMPPPPINSMGQIHSEYHQSGEGFTSNSGYLPQNNYQGQQHSAPYQHLQPQYHHEQQPQHPQQHQHVRPGEETSAWDPNAYYGSGGGGGELNWWEQ